MDNQSKISEERRMALAFATARAQGYLKKGDRIRAHRCAGVFRTYTFDHFEGEAIVTKGGIDDIHALNIDRVNSIDIDFAA